MFCAYFLRKVYGLNERMPTKLYIPPNSSAVYTGILYIIQYAHTAISFVRPSRSKPRIRYVEQKAGKRTSASLYVEYTGKGVVLRRQELSLQHDLFSVLLYLKVMAVYAKTSRNVLKYHVMSRSLESSRKRATVFTYRHHHASRKGFDHRALYLLYLFAVL